jgi:hypothetical protein
MKTDRELVMEAIARAEYRWSTEAGATIRPLSPSDAPVAFAVEVAETALRNYRAEVERTAATPTVDLVQCPRCLGDGVDPDPTPVYGAHRCRRCGGGGRVPRHLA